MMREDLTLATMKGSNAMSKMRILAAVDEDDQVEALTHAVALWAKGGPSDVTIIGVAPEFSAAIANPAISSRAKDAERTMLDDLKQRLKQVADGLHVDAEIDLLSGSVADEIIKAAVLRNADVVIKTADRPVAQTSPVFGAVEKKLIRKCPAPVWILRDDAPMPPKSLVVAIDSPHGSADDQRVEIDKMAASLLDNAVAFALRFGVSEIKLLHACTVVGAPFVASPRMGWSPKEVEAYVEEWRKASETWLENFKEEASKRYSQTGIKFTTYLETGAAGRALVSAVKDLDTDVLFIGSANRSGIPGLFIGNTAETVIDQVECSVYVVKPQGFSSIITPAIQEYAG